MASTPELTLERLKAKVARHAAIRRPQDWPEAWSIVDIANDAGEWLVGLRPWNWLAAAPASLDIVAGQSFLTLPDDFGRFIALRSQGTSAHVVKMGSMEEVVIARGNGSATAGTFIGAMLMTRPSLAGPKPVSRIELGPIPSSTSTAALLLAYTSCWPTISQSGDHVIVPSWLMAAYVRACACFFGGYEREGEGSLEERLDRLLASSVMQSAFEYDDSLEQDLGRIRHGAAEMLTLEAEDSPFPNTPGSFSIVNGS